MAARSKRGGRFRKAAGGRGARGARSSGAAGRKTARRARSAAKPRSAAKRRARQPARPRAFRLAADVRPTHYEIALDVDPARGRDYSGVVEIRLRLERPRRAIEIHAAELRLAGARIEAAGREQRGRITLHPERESAEIVFAQPVAAGEATLRLAFRGRLRSDLRGLYAAASGERRYAFTQLEAADARRFFPCFDEPAFKARFRLSVTTDAALAVISNGRVAAVERHGTERKTVRFEATPPLSTYLVALAVGELEASEPEHVGRTEIRVWHVPGKKHLAGFGLEAARESLARLEAYFDLPYPYSKLDLVAVPDFEAGAMENAGAVFFRETLLLVDPATVTLQERKRVAEVVCHELAHMWYGDLVTMAWWNDLWLNEAFATWMAFTVVDQWKPEWKMWHDFEHHRAAALQLDALASTHPIYTEVRSPAEATQNFDLITYEKGASVVRMIERFLGAETFRAGVRSYIRRHRESNATAADLWSALQQASGEAVEPVVRAWIEQPGFPLLALRRRRQGGRTELELTQERFFAKPGAHGRGTLRWPVPWLGRVGAAGGGPARLERQLVTRARQRLDLGPGEPRFVYGNAEEGGFYRPLHDAAELRALAAALPELRAVERMGLLGHQWALVRAGRAPVEGLLELLGAYGAEEDPDVLLSLRGILAFLDDQLARAAGGDTPQRFRAWVGARFGAQLDALGWDAAPDEPDDTRVRRAAVVGILGEIAESKAVLGTAGRRFEAYLRDRSSLEPNLADPVVTLAARAGDAARFAALRGALEAAATPQERRRFLLSLGEFRERSQVERALALTLDELVPTQDVALLLVRLLGNPAARERTWEFLKRRWKALRRRMPPMLASRVVEATPSLQSAAHRRDVAAFFREHPLPTAQRALRQALERFDLNAELRRRAAPGLRRFFATDADAAPPRRGPA